MNTEISHATSIEESTSDSRPCPPLNLPCGDLLGNTDYYNNICVPLYNASMECNWEAASVILGQHQHQGLDLLGFAITENYDTALHIAASAKSSRLMEMFVKILVNQMTNEQLELQNKKYNTALCLAATTAGNLNIAVTMVEKNKALLDIPGHEGAMPLYMASLSGESEMVNFFYDKSNKMTGAFWTDENRSKVLRKCVELDLFDVAMKIVTDLPELSADNKVLELLARKTEAFAIIKPHFFSRFMHQIFSVICMKKVVPAEKPRDAMLLLRIIWGNIMKLPKAKIEDILGNQEIIGPADHNSQPLDILGNQEIIGPADHNSQPLFVAVNMGNTEFVVELIRQYPDLLWKRNDNNQTIFHVAIIYRHEDIYNILHEVGESIKDMITSVVDMQGNNMLHLAAMWPKEAKRDYNSGVGLQMQLMQREVLWFEEVKNMVPLWCQEKPGGDFGFLPHKLFEFGHRRLLSDNEKWMKDTANQCLVVAALIASIAFTAAFAVPGGYNQNNGIPIFLHHRAFIVFVISDAISLALSSISILIFLSIFISRYAENDFLESLPKKLMKGLAALFFSITAMLVGFGVSFFTFLQDKLIWVPVMISMLISLPIILFARLQYYLVMDVYQSTYGSRNLFKPKKPRLYPQNQNPRF
ncbi:uncharacterized protein LOC111894211 [Lactuca sativa]|uniref:PGG domain-containing protein n=1 Tax=Lactuca sativa TaxID=4236 RepID=A0A9R1V7I0_LACSA|nr:uncharacterized protein LOC111894211 [Lactuca sativa]KAJ0201712.1 hypothetical protein LSAT_V11C600310070 [Lactuca sativa]